MTNSNTMTSAMNHSTHYSPLWLPQCRRYGLRVAASIMALCSLAACANHTGLGDGVSQAYNSSGSIDVPSYTRTIFSSTNF